MEILKILAISVALAMDAFAVAIAIGICLKKLTIGPVFRLSFHFGLFQAIMPAIGWGIGIYIHSFIDSYAPWIAFALLVWVGGHMIKEALSDEMKETCQIKDPTRGIKLLVLSIATSIDALAVGFSISLMAIPIAVICVVIGLTASGFTVLGLYIGKKAAETVILREVAEIFGGIVLFIIGGNILYEHHAVEHLFESLKTVLG